MNPEAGAQIDDDKTRCPILGNSRIGIVCKCQTILGAAQRTPSDASNELR